VFYLGSSPGETTIFSFPIAPTYAFASGFVICSGDASLEMEGQSGYFLSTNLDIIFYLRNSLGLTGLLEVH
jgi:hypothetical protein